MSKIMWTTFLGRGTTAAAIGFAVSLLAGAVASYFPGAPLEGVAAGVLVSAALSVATYFVLLRTRAGQEERHWIFDLHSVLGLATGVLWGAFCLSGALLLYRAELNLAWNPGQEVEPAQTYAPVDAWVEAVAAHTDLNGSKRVEIVWPDGPAHPAKITVNSAKGRERFAVDPYRARVIEGDFKTWLDGTAKFHRHLLLGTAGNLIGGVVSVAAAWAAIGGLMMGRRVFLDWRRLRWRMGLPVFLSDLHKRIGLWLLPFVAVYALTGAMYEFGNIYRLGPIKVRFDGNPGAMWQAMGSAPYVASSTPHPTPGMDEFVAAMQRVMPGSEPRLASIRGYGDRDAVVEVRGTRRGDLAPDGYSVRLNLRASTGEVLKEININELGVFERTNLALDMFHIAAYGGPWIRALHAIAAVAIGVLPFIGIWIWFSRRRRARAA